MRNCLVFGYGQNSDGSLNDETKNRCDVAVYFYKKQKLDIIHITVGVQIGGVLMADAMKDYMVEQGVRSSDIILRPCGFNTAGEMDVFLSALCDKDKVVFVSTWYHIPRICYLAIWRTSLTRFSCKTAWKHFSWTKDVLVEFAKIAYVLFRPRGTSRVSK